MPKTDDATSQAQQSGAVALQARFNQGLALHKQGKLADAELIYGEVLQQQPNHFDALHLLGAIAVQSRRTEQGAELIKKAIGLNDRVAAAHSNLGYALLDLNRAEEALASYDRAIVLQPDNAEAHYNRGNALQDLKRPEEAIASYDRAITLEGDYAAAYNNRGNALRELRRSEEALASYDRAITLKPDYAEAFRNQSLYFLQLGRFEQGWRQYEWRKKLDRPMAARSYPQPLWLGEEDIVGKTLFVWWEQGFGDTIQFCRYAKLAQARGAKVIMSVQQRLHGLIQQISPTIQIIGENKKPAEFDYHCPMLSLPLAFKTTLETIPAEPSYLKADEELRKVWAARLPPKTRPRIGVVWSAGKTYTNDRERSMAMATMLPLFRVDADWICLQKEIRDTDAAARAQLGSVAFFGDEQRDFSDAAALLDLMDVVITVDTSVAHLAGAMGKPVWIMLPYNPDWRWLLDREDCPWYPSARLFRQQQIGNWADVMDRVKSELKSLID